MPLPPSYMVAQTGKQFSAISEVWLWWSQKLCSWQKRKNVEYDCFSQFAAQERCDSRWKIWLLRYTINVIFVFIQSYGRTNSLSFGKVGQAVAHSFFLTEQLSSSSLHSIRPLAGEWLTRTVWTSSGRRILFYSPQTDDKIYVIIVTISHVNIH